MLRVSYRYVFPLLALMVTAALYFAGRRQQQGIEPASWDGPPPRPIEIAIALNIPGAIAALPGGLLFELATGGLDHPSRGGMARNNWQLLPGRICLWAVVHDRPLARPSSRSIAFFTNPLRSKKLEDNSRSRIRGIAVFRLLWNLAYES
jgi:hypothetical protein